MPLFKYIALQFSGDDNVRHFSPRLSDGQTDYLLSYKPSDCQADCQTNYLLSYELSNCQTN